jgi:hypothetical protein
MYNDAAAVQVLHLPWALDDPHAADSGEMQQGSEQHSSKLAFVHHRSNTSAWV